jgi:hypothetical protein
MWARLENVADDPANEFAWKTLRRMNARTADSRIYASPSVPCEFIRGLPIIKFKHIPPSRGFSG